MNRFTQFLISPLFLNILGIIAFSALVWFGFDYISFGEENTKLPHSIRAIIILGFILLLMFIWIIKLWRRQSNNNQMIEEIQQVEEPNIEEERTSEEISALNQRFSDALSVLKRANLSSGGKSRTLYELPWYIIIGPPGSGKTTALVNSDLDFPLAQSHGKGSLGGVGGTRNCDWWFTNESVLIDTAGRYTTQDSHRVIDNTAWQNFLGLLKKYRPMRPINGALVAVSLQDLITQTPEQRENQAKLIRERINELQQELNIRFPVYVILTKCDLVPGFNEFFANLTQSERQQVWGMTFNSENNEEIVHGLPAQFQQLVNSLNERMMWRVHNERDVDKRALIQGFPEQIGHLHPIILGYLKQLMTPNLYTKHPLFRGVYLSSGTQEGMPIDRMMASVSRDFGFNNDKSRMYSGNGKSYFIHRLFKDIIFPEAEVVGSNQKLEKRTGILRKVYFAGLGFAFLATLSTWSYTVAKNNEYIDQVNEQISLYHKSVQKLDPASFSPADTLTALSHLDKGANIYNQDSHPWLTGLGLYDGTVDKAADDLYKNALKTLLLPRLNDELLSALKKNTRGAQLESSDDNLASADVELDPANRLGSIEGDDQLIDSLRAYLMLTDKTHRNTDVIETWFDEHWGYSMSGRASEQESLKQHLATLMENPFTSPNANNEAIAQARQKLQKIPIAQRLYIQLVADSANSPALDLYSELGGINAALLGHRDPTAVFYMPYIFTKEGYKEIKFDKDMPLLNNLEKDRWIYGNEIAQADFTEEDKEALAEELKTLYLADYAAKWQRFGGIFKTPKFANLNDAGRKLQQFSDPLYSPILAYLKLIKDNTALTPDWSGAKLPTKRLQRSRTGRALKAATKLANKMNEPTRVDIHFHPLNKLIKADDKQPAPAANILAVIKTLDSQMSELAIAPDSSEAAFNIAKGRFGGGGGPISKLYLLSKRSPEPLNGWLKSLADESWRIVIGKAQGHLNKSWRQQVYDVYRKNLANQYPLKKQRSATASVDVFNEFFGPGGIEEAFVESEIKPFLNTRTWRLKSVNNKVLPISGKAIAMFKQASYIRRAFYGQGASSASAKFNLKPLNLDSTVGRFELRMGENRYSYTHGPKITKRTQWIAGETVPISIFFEDLNKTIHEQQYEGDWAWLRLLDSANIQRQSNKKYRVTFNKGSRQATYQMTTKSQFNIFNLNLLRNYKISARL